MENEKIQSNEEKGKASKRMIAVCILDILSKRKGISEKLTYDDIITELKGYGIEARRKAIHENINALLELQKQDTIPPFFHIGYDTKKRIVNGEEQEIHTNFHMEDPLQEYRWTDEELIMLTDYVKSNKNIATAQAENLINRIMALANPNTDLCVERLKKLNDSISSHSNVSDILKKIHKAIDENKQIEIKMCKYNALKELVPEQGSITLNPCQTLISQGEHYLIGSRRKHTALSHYRIEKIYSLDILDTAIEPIAQKNTVEQYIREKYLAIDNRTYPVELRVKAEMVDDVIDEFGKRIDIFSNTEKNRPWKDSCTVKLQSDVETILRFVWNHVDSVELIQPQWIRNKMIYSLCALDWNYHSQWVDYYTEAVYMAPYKDKLCVEHVDLSVNREPKFISTIPLITEARFIHTNLSDISFFNPDPKTGINGINIEVLDIIDNPIKDGKPIAEIKKLRHLMLVKTNIEDISFLEKCDNLRSLVLVDNPVMDYSVLFRMKNLKMLTIGIEESTRIDLDELKRSGKKIDIASVKRFIRQEPKMQRLEGASYKKLIRDLRSSRNNENNDRDEYGLYKARQIK